VKESVHDDGRMDAEKETDELGERVHEGGVEIGAKSAGRHGVTCSWWLRVLAYVCMYVLFNVL
jgi:hypothetical protein